MNKKGDLQSIIMFSAVFLIIIMLAPMLLKIVVTPLNKFGDALSNVDSSKKSVDAVNYVKNKFTGLFDWIIMFFFIFNVVLLIVTAFLVDIHPAFAIIYIVGLFFLIITAPAMLGAINNIWDMAQFSTGDENVTQYLPMLNFVREHFTFIVLGIAIISGLIMFGKYRFSQTGSGNGNYY